MADKSCDPSDSSNPSLTSCPGDSEGEKGSSPEPTRDVTPDKELPTTLPPVVCRTLEDGPPGQEGIGEGVGMGADPTTRVLGLLGMGHRLFVPRLLAVRGGSGSEREGETETSGKLHSYFGLGNVVRGSLHWTSVFFSCRVWIDHN